MRRSVAATIAIHAGALLLAAITLAPLLWLFIMSIMEPRELLAVPLKWFPDAPDFSRYARLLGFTERPLDRRRIDHRDDGVEAIILR